MTDPTTVDSGASGEPTDDTGAVDIEADNPPGGDHDGDDHVVSDDHAGDDDTPPSTTRTVVEWVAVIGGALAVALVIQAFLVQAFYIPSSSMEPTLDIGDRVLVNKLSYDLHDINRGDLIVFERPDEAVEGEIKDLIKRVMGLPGETIEIRDGTVLIDGRAVDEPYLSDDEVLAEFAPVEIPDGHVFVMGDNRDDSRDSRVFGPIPESSIIGRAFVRVWPFTRLGSL